MKKYYYALSALFWLLLSHFSEFSFGENIRKGTYADFMLLSPISLLSYSSDILDQLKNIRGIDHRMGFFNHSIMIPFYVGLFLSAWAGLQEMRKS